MLTLFEFVPNHTTTSHRCGCSSMARASSNSWRRATPSARRTGKSQHESYHEERSIPIFTAWADTKVWHGSTSWRASLGRGSGASPSACTTRRPVPVFCVASRGPQVHCTLRIGMPHALRSDTDQGVPRISRESQLPCAHAGASLSFRPQALASSLQEIIQKDFSNLQKRILHLNYEKAYKLQGLVNLGRKSETHAHRSRTNRTKPRPVFALENSKCQSMGIRSGYIQGHRNLIHDQNTIRTRTLASCTPRARVSSGRWRLYRDSVSSVAYKTRERGYQHPSKHKSRTKVHPPSPWERLY